MRNRWATILLSLLPLGVFPLATASADDVYMTNGKSFDNVVAVVTDTQVRILMPGGEIRVPRSSVARVEAGDSSFAEYLGRKQALGRDGKAADWLELAHWAKANGFDPGAREAALKAAELDPSQKGLAGLLRPFGFVFDAGLDRYIPYADSMHRKGYVQSGSQWISREESAQLAREREERSARFAAEQAVEASRRAADAQRELAELQLQQAAQADQPTAVPYDGTLATGLYLPGIGYGGYSGGFYGSHGRGGSHHGRSPHPGSGGSVGGPWRQPVVGGAGGGQHNSQGYNQLVGRVPGSLFPAGGPGKP